MASTGMGLLMVLVTLFSFWAATRAQSDCTNVIITLAPCLNYVSGSSSTPSPSCCSQLASVVKSNPRCLCTVLNGGGSSFGVSINETLALALPGACNVETPPVSRCNEGSPETSPSDTTSGTGSKVVPSNAVSGSASNTEIINTPRRLVLILAVFMVPFALTASSF
ncbi:non-specific lipid-transfer protein-like protein At2g13820 isoform X2 [Pistacia vera]|uniref:non-specific lipid-transfer protein-like protein At2g13820 isoform X2 n=1 Tax=Pistacia vera TaxID=55513 RepID=UPI001263690E|nr:non-specific lipid-transfer protein-like protein At2g13820 isoform X2 [Pistacia vera]XP_031278208.1 non-specific lipid-transfer protein-like protein At2g13820 isoform X2 [Pistacia vera]